jgi:uncharacterized repeat protein (TIGR01451 family)
MFKLKYNPSWLVSLMFLLILATMPASARAQQWPPFKFRLDSVYENGKITYQVQFSRQVNWTMTDVIFKIPVPVGTRFVEAGAPPTTTFNFDGTEITFSTLVLNRSLKDTYFVVEVTDPTRTEFTTHAWISWKGEQPGDLLTDDISIDITRTPLTWEKPSSRLRLEASASVSGDVITYTFYPVNVGGRRMWDLTVNVPLPEGTTFLSAEAPSSFVSSFNGQAAIFSKLELARNSKIEPLRVQVSSAGVTTPFVVTQAWASWTNVGRNVPQYEQTKTGNIIVQSDTNQQVFADNIGDAPFPSYDLTSLAFQEDGDALKTTFFTADALGPVGEPVELLLYIDSDCNAATGKPRGNRGAEYWIRYRHQNGQAYLYSWDETQAQWTNRRSIGAYPTEINLSTVWIPGSLMGNNQQFCWIGVAWNRTEAYHPSPPVDWLGVIDTRLTQ